MNPFTETHSESVAALGETRLLREIRKWLGRAAPAEPFGMGDDCAVLPRGLSARLVTVDPVIYGGHFNASMPPRATAQKLLKRNLSDLAAMGGQPVAAVLALTLDRRTSLRWLEGFYRELAACACEYAVPIVGGDIAEAPAEHLSASLTLLGNPSRGGRVLTRSGAQAGDSIYVTGELGNTLDSGHHYRFTPRLAEGAWLARQRAVHSMIDISDGLSKDLKALEAGGIVADGVRHRAGAAPAAARRRQPLSAQIFAERLPLRRGADQQSALCGGEDYELIFSLAERVAPRDFERRWRAVFPKTKLTRIGYFAPAKTRAEGALSLEDYHGYEHL